MERESRQNGTDSESDAPVHRGRVRRRAGMEGTRSRRGRTRGQYETERVGGNRVRGRGRRGRTRGQHEPEGVGGNGARGRGRRGGTQGQNEPGKVGGTRARGIGRRGGRGEQRGARRRESRTEWGSDSMAGTCSMTSESVVEWSCVDHTHDSQRHSFLFTPPSGPRLQFSKPYEYYTHFLGDAFLVMMIRGTNTYAEHKISELRRLERLSRESRWNRWKPVTEEEMRAVIVVIINMGIPDLESYWKTSWECYIPFFHDVIGRNRFQEIFWNLHIPQPSSSSHGHPTPRVDKVAFLLDHIHSKSQAAFYPGQEVAIDETMVGFRGRVSFKQYCPKNPLN